MKKKKKLPIGRDNFKDIIEKNFYYFDKTELIEKLIDDDFEVTLFTRPRRFGKSLNMSMLKYFFDIRNSEENKKLFENLYISKSEYFEKQGQNPTILVSFKDIKKDYWEESYRLIKNMIFDLFKEYKYIYEVLDEEEKKEFKNFEEKNIEARLDEALKILCKYLYKYYGKKVVLLIDEYDTPLIYAYENGYYKEAINFFKTFYGSALKGNEYLDKGVLTGILRVVREGIFSDLNNLMIYTVLDNDYTDSFGLTEEEVLKALKYYEIDKNIEDMKKWYNGYKFGEEKIYNPWSIINYLKKGELISYWVNTSNDSTIMRLLKSADESVSMDLKKIFEGKEVLKLVDRTSNMNDLRNSQEVWQLMLFSGYLTIEKQIDREEYTLKIPNYEVRTFFKKAFIEYNFRNRSNFMEMMRALLSEDLALYQYKLQEIMMISYSYHDGDKKNEKPYHNLILGMILYLDDRFIIESNIENGLGRSDLILIPKNIKDNGYIFEFKAVDEEKDIEKGLDIALNQIKEKKYDIKLQDKMKNINNTNKIIKIGMVFFGKRVEIKWE